MREIITPDSNPRRFVSDAMQRGYSMDESLFHPFVGENVSRELEEAGQLVEYNELKPTSMFQERGMHFANLMHSTLSRLVRGVDPSNENPLPLFSVRVFKPGIHGTTIHRNDTSIKDWAIGVTLKGDAPFNVYDQDDLPAGTVIGLAGDETDPKPLESMDAGAGSAWALYTKHQQMPHASGIVNSYSRRELLVMYGSRDSAYYLRLYRERHHSQ